MYQSMDRQCSGSVNNTCSTSSTRRVCGNTVLFK